MKRLKIPAEIKLKIWVLSGGRCEYPGCNQLVWRDGLTLKEDNFGDMAHLVAYSPDGPRGHVSLSSEKATDFNNLMLLCLNHHRLVDGKNKSEYTLELLKQYKKEHEDRIRMQTEVGPDMATTVVRFAANIRERRVSVNISKAYQAIFPRFPRDEKGILMDFSGKDGVNTTSDYWKGLAHDISEQVKRDFAMGNDRLNHEHLSVFALGPIPLLIHLGNQIGNPVPVDLYQKHRDTNDWKWKDEPKQDSFAYDLKKEKGAKDASKIALVLSLSGKIHSSEYRSILPSVPLYEISIPEPQPEFLLYRSRLEKFRTIYCKVISEIRERYGKDAVIHLFPAISAPVAVLCGKELLPKSAPQVLVYDNDRTKGGFIPTLTIN